MRRKHRAPTKKRDSTNIDLHEKLHDWQKLAIEITVFLSTLYGLYKILTTLIEW